MKHTKPKMSQSAVHSAFKRAIALTKGKKMSRDERSKVFKRVFAMAKKH